MKAVEPGDFHQVGQAARELTAVGLAEQAAPVLVDWANLADGIQGAAGAVVPFGMTCHCLGDFLKGLAGSRAAEVEHRQAIRCRTGLKKALLERSAKRKPATLALAEVAQTVEDLAMVRRDNQHLRVVSAQDRLFEPLERQVAFLTVELR